MKNKFEIDQQEAAAAAQVAANLAIFNRWYEKHPEIPRNAAGGVAESVLRMFQEYMDFTDPLTESDFDFAYSNLQKQIMLRRVPTPAEVKAELIDEICDLLKSPDGTGRGGKYCNFDIKSVRSQMAFWDIPKLEARKDEIIREQEMTKKSLSELKAIVAESRKDDRPFPGWPTLPKQIVRPGTITAVPLDRDYIRGLSSYELRRLNRLYSEPQVNARLQGLS